MKVIKRTFTLEQIEEADAAMAGYCLACGAWHDCCEPDACGYNCEECGEDKVYGAAEIAMMGLIKDDDNV